MSLPFAAGTRITPLRRSRRAGHCGRAQPSPSHRPGPEPDSPEALGGEAAPPGKGPAFPRALTGCPEHHDQFLPGHEETRAVPGLCQGEKQRRSHRRAGPAQPPARPRSGGLPRPREGGGGATGRLRGPIAGLGGSPGRRGAASPHRDGWRRPASPYLGSALFGWNRLGSAGPDCVRLGSARPDSVRFRSATSGWAGRSCPSHSQAPPTPATGTGARPRRAGPSAAIAGGFAGPAGTCPPLVLGVETRLFPRNIPPTPSGGGTGRYPQAQDLGLGLSWGDAPSSAPWQATPGARQNKQRGGSGAFLSTPASSLSAQGLRRAGSRGLRSNSSCWAVGRLNLVKMLGNLGLNQVKSPENTRGMCHTQLQRNNSDALININE